MVTKHNDSSPLNAIGLDKDYYIGAPTTLCAGCGHNSISRQIMTACFELSIRPEKVIKTSGIGCSSKSPAYFLSRAYGLNALHGRVPSVTTGALMVNHSLIGLAVSGDGDTASIGLGQFKHLLRRNVPLVYIVENNGVYGLTKGQFSATADIGQELKYAGRNELLPIDIALEAVISGCGYVARTFSGDAKQVVTLLKGALCHNGTAVLDIISPCMAFNNHNESTKSYTWGKKHNTPLHDITYIPSQTEISVDYELGTTHTVELHDGASLILKKLDADYDPTDQAAAIRLLTEARAQQLFITGLVYYNPNRPSLRDLAHLPKTPLVNLANEQLRPSPQSLQELMGELS